MGQSQAAPLSPVGDGPSIFLYMCPKPSTKSWDGRGSTEQRLEAGCIQLTPATSACREERSPLFGSSSYSHQSRHRLRAAEPHVMYRSGLAQNGPCWPLSVLSSPSQLCAGSMAWLSKGWSVWPGMGINHSLGMCPSHSPQSWAKHSWPGRRCCRPCSPEPRWARCQPGCHGSGALLPGSALSPGHTAVEVPGLSIPPVASGTAVPGFCGGLSCRECD